MIKGWKDLEHDLELVEAKNMKILCKNIKHGRASKLFKSAQFQQASTGRASRRTTMRDVLRPFSAFARLTCTDRASTSTAVPCPQLPFL